MCCIRTTLFRPTRIPKTSFISRVGVTGCIEEVASSEHSMMMNNCMYMCWLCVK